MKPIKFVAFLFYRYYSGGRRPDSVPYFRTICSMSLLAFIHVLQILIILDKVNFIPLYSTDGKGTKTSFIILVMLPIYFTMTQLIKKKELEKMKDQYSYNWDKVFNWNVWLIVYMILSFSLIFILAFWSK